MGNASSPPIIGINKLKMHFLVNYFSLENKDFSSSNLEAESDVPLLKSTILYYYIV